jgi:hypothetical protein
LGNKKPCEAIDLCASSSVTESIYFWAQTNTQNVPDQGLDGIALGVQLVGKTNYTPFITSVQPGNEALNVSWDWPAGQNPAADTNFLGVQLFCQRGTNLPVFKLGSFGAPKYATAAILCPDSAPTDPNPSQFNNLDEAYLCSGLIPSTNKSARIEGLQNGAPYGVGVAAIDRYGNISPIGAADIHYEWPVPTVDFYSEYREQGGSAQGGFCALAGRNARSGVAALIFVAGMAAILRLRRRSKKGPPGAGPYLLVVGAGLLAGSQAHAQPVYYDSAFAEDKADEVWNGSPRQFAIEARFGLYTPNVDSEFSKTTPHADVFGTTRRPMWQLEFDWEFLQDFGTLSLAGVVGYYKENAQACTRAGLQRDGTCPTPDPKKDPAAATKGRSGDNTGLRLIPLAMLLVYRMDEVANRWKIPFVPYAKIGLNYTIWTVTNGNGDVAWSGNIKGQGGTMGWQAAVGLSLRLDFLDPGAARGFDADSGVNHTYAFFELDHVNGSGLYRKDVLRVGDDTWFAGLMFEF